tara:strand:+ start:536 stop:1027 length:492 start_codon:yes stop_codon:yes gene_type:complete
MTKKKVPMIYIPTNLSTRDKIKQSTMLKKSIKQYKKGKFYTRKKVNSFKSKLSPHIVKARKIYNIYSIIPSDTLAKKTGCSIVSLKKIVKKGQGAYFSSGSRPNQTAKSWGYARLASSITGGKASLVDYNILNNGCNSKSKAIILSKKARIVVGMRKTPSITL